MSDAVDKINKSKEELGKELDKLDKEVIARVIDTVIAIASQMAKEKISDKELLKDVISCLLIDDCQELKKCLKDVVKEYFLVNQKKQV